MSDENYPRLLREIPGWQFRRWTYDAAPLEAHRVCRHHGDEGGWSVEIDDAGIEHGKAVLGGSTGRALSRGKLTQEEHDALHARVTYTSDLADLAGCQLVVEAVPEHLDLKTFFEDEAGGQAQRLCATAGEVVDRSVDREVADVAAGEEQRVDHVGVGGESDPPARHGQHRGVA